MWVFNLAVTVEDGDIAFDPMSKLEIHAITGDEAAITKITTLMTPSTLSSRHRAWHHQDSCQVDNQVRRP